MDTINARIAQVFKAAGLSKTEAAARLKLSQQYTSKLTLCAMPSDRTIRDICIVFNVDEHWLRTGEGNMAVPLSEEDEFSQFMGELMQEFPNSFRSEFIASMAQLSPEQWQLVEQFTTDLAARMARKND